MQNIAERQLEISITLKPRRSTHLSIVSDMRAFLTISAFFAALLSRELLLRRMLSVFLIAALEVVLGFLSLPAVHSSCTYPVFQRGTRLRAYVQD